MQTKEQTDTREFAPGQFVQDSPTQVGDPGGREMLISVVFVQVFPDRPM